MVYFLRMSKSYVSYSYGVRIIREQDISHNVTADNRVWSEHDVFTNYLTAISSGQSHLRRDHCETLFVSEVHAPRKNPS